MENQTLEDIDKVEKLESSIFDGIVHHDEVPHTSMHDVVGFDNHGDAQNHLSNQHVDVDNNSDIVIDDRVAYEVVNESNIPLRWSIRQRFPSSRYLPNEYVLLTDGGEPECYEEAMEDEHKNQWIEFMQDEMKSLHENHTYELVKLPKGMRALKNKWVFKVKVEEHNLKPRYKARLVVKGFGQRKCIDFDEIFSPVVKMSSIRTVLGLVASLDLEIE